MLAYKFLSDGAIGPVSGARFPTPPSDGAPGAWLEVDGPLITCARGVHVCRPSELAHWLNDELWQLETEGDAVEGVDCLVVRRARLLCRIDAWSAGGAARFATACNQHAAEIVGVDAGSVSRGFIDDGKLAAAAGYFAVSAYCAALAVMRHGAAADIERVYRQERAWQGSWIARELLAA